MTAFVNRKRNDKCRERICACTGACFVDDGTGDFAPKRVFTERQMLRNLNDFLSEDILEMSDEEIMQETLEEFGSQEAVDAEILRLRSIVQKAIEKAKQIRTKGLGVK